jgi:hypothetical protein
MRFILNQHVFCLGFSKRQPWGLLHLGVTPCDLVEVCWSFRGICCLHHLSEDGGRRFLQNDSTLLTLYMVWQARRQQCSSHRMHQDSNNCTAKQTNTMEQIKSEDCMVPFSSETTLHCFKWKDYSTILSVALHESEYSGVSPLGNFVCWVCLRTSSWEYWNIRGINRI